ncbi:MAG TPA: sporulation protein YqfD, partial [Clostridia bacterium]|nr:sporulation protein YqfD [Clostridia bacterium]
MKMWKYFSGYLLIKVEGLSLEKFINLCVSRGIKLWGIKRVGYTSLTVCIGIKDFKALPAIVRLLHCRVKILDKRGFPFLTYGFRHRKMLIIGMVIFLIILYGLSSFIWTVEVEGNVKIQSELLYNLLEDKGIKPGVSKRELDIWDIQNEILMDIPEISWISIELKGTRAITRVVEGVQAPLLIDKDKPCNIVATKDGIIQQLIILEGEGLVEVGDTVKKGQLLVSGIIDHEDTGVVRYVHAMSKIYARTWYEGEGSGDFAQVAANRTGEKISRKHWETKAWEININGEEIPFKEYEVEERKKPIFNLGNFAPIFIVTRDFYEIQSNTTADIDRLAKEKAEKEALENAMKKIPKGAKAVDKKFKYDIIKDIGYEVV